MIFIARRTSILDTSNDRVSLASNTIITSGVCYLDETTTVWSWGFVLHPEIGESCDDRGVGVLLTTGTGPTFLKVNRPEAGVARGAGQLDMNEQRGRKRRTRCVWQVLLLPLE